MCADCFFVCVFVQIYDKAIADFTSAIELDPSNADFYHNRGFSCRKQGKFNLALEDYMEAIKRNPKHSRAYYNRAFVLERLGNFHEAIKDYTTALELEPNNSIALHNRGVLYVDLPLSTLITIHLSLSLSHDRILPGKAKD